MPGALHMAALCQRRASDWADAIRDGLDPDIAASSAIRPGPGGCWPTLMPDAQNGALTLSDVRSPTLADRLPAMHAAPSVFRRKAP